MAFLLRSFASRLIRKAPRRFNYQQMKMDESRMAMSTSSKSIPQDPSGEYEEDVEKLKASLDQEQREHLEKIMGEYEIFKYADSRMPSKLVVRNWRRMLQMESKNERIQYLTFLYDKERLELKEKMEKARSDPELEQRVEYIRRQIKRQAKEHIYYGIGGSCLFRRILDADMNKSQNHKLGKAMALGPHLIFDMSFFPIMRPIELSLTCKQLLTVHHDNRAHRFPHHIIFTGCNKSHPSWEDVRHYFRNGFENNLYTVTEKHYLDLFEKEQLVYLSPDAKLAVQEYDAHKIYIVGACVDRIARPNMTLARAKEEGIEARRLPMERCVRLIGNKALCLNHLVSIMNDAHALGSITAAILNNLPKRKVASTHNLIGRNKREYDRQRLQYLRSVAKTT